MPGCSVDSTRFQCSNQDGGLFDEGSSTTWSTADLTALRTAGDSSLDQHDCVWGSDTLRVNTTLSISDFPLGIFRGKPYSQNTLGLGRNSTLLNALVSTGAIVSKSFSIFQGWTGAQTRYQTDGSLTIGGYDSAKITGNNITLPFTVEDSCPSGLMISVTDVIMNLKNGSNVSIIGESRGSALRACIEPAFTPISLSEDIWWAFTKVTGVAETYRSLSTWGMIIPANGAYAEFSTYSALRLANANTRYDGDLTFSIYPGLDIRIPNHQLVVPDIEINAEGQDYRPNSTVVQVLINSLQAINKDDMPLFGLPFLSSVYLIVDNDKQQFTLSQSQQSSTSNLVAIGPPACDTPAPSPTSQPLPTIIASSTLAPKSNPSSGTPIGAIPGAVVGGLAVIAICTGLFFNQKRRRFKRLRGEEKQERGTMREADSAKYTGLEMPSDGQPPQEMPLDRDSNQGIPPYEMPGTPRLRRPDSAM